jgi:tetratricopeptide (TPR) repeat protein
MKKLIPCVLILLLVFGCAPHFKKERELSKPLIGLAISKIQQNDIQGALIELRKAQKANSSDPEVYYYLAYAYQISGKYDKAIENADKAISYADHLDLDHPGLKSESYNLKGTILSAQGKNEEAIEAFKKALKDELYQTPEYVYNNLGALYLQMKNIPLALENAQKALDANSHYAPAWELLARIYVLQGKTSDAIGALKHAILEFPAYTEAHWELAQLYLQTGNKVEGKQQLLEVLKLDPDGPFGQMAAEKLKGMK